MSPVAVINYGAANDYAKMLPEFADELYVFSHHALTNTDAFAYYEHVPYCEFLPYADFKIVEMARDVKFTHLITDNEYDLERAARLRARLGIAGQSHEGAESFRDKLIMKQRASAAVPTPAFRRLDNVLDLLDFIDDLDGAPVIVKPRKQGGSRDISVIRDVADLERFCRRHWRDDLMVESYLDAEIYHVDAIIAKDYRFVSSSKYLRTPLGVLSGQNNGSLQLHPSEPLAIELEQFLDRVLGAFDTPAISAYHLEVFRDADGKLLLCEIASRVGGARIPAITRATYGLDLVTTWLRLTCGLAVDPAPSGPPTVVHGAVAIVPLGYPVTVPDRLPFGWVRDYQVNRQIAPDAVAQNSTTNLCYAVVEGANSAELVQRLLESEQWILSNSVRASST